MRFFVYAILGILLAGGLMVFAQAGKALTYPSTPGIPIPRSGCYGDSVFSTNLQGYICDNDETTKWVSGLNSNPHYFVVNFTDQYILTSFEIHWVDSPPTQITLFINNLSKTDWIPVVSFSTPFTANDYDLYTLASGGVIAKAVKITAVAGGTIWIQTFEARFFGESFAPLTATLIASPVYGPAPLNVSFEGAAGGGCPGLTGFRKFYVYGEEPIDGPIGIGDERTDNPTHVYNVPGVYTAYLYILDSCNILAHSSVTITVIPETPTTPISSLHLLVLFLLGSIWLAAAIAGTILRTGFFVILGGISALAFAITAWSTTGELFSSTLLFAAAVLTLAWAPFMADRERTPE